MSGYLKKMPLVLICTLLLFFVHGVSVSGCGTGVDCIPASHQAQHAAGRAHPSHASLPCPAGAAVDCCQMPAEVVANKYLIASNAYQHAHFQNVAPPLRAEWAVDPNRTWEPMAQDRSPSQSNPIPLYLLHAVWRC